MKSLDEILARGRQDPVSLEELPRVLGERVRRQRLAFEWRQSDLAERADLSPQTIKAIEAGANVSLLSFLRVMDVLGHGPSLVQVLDRPNFPTLKAMDHYEALLPGVSSPVPRQRIRVRPAGDHL